MDEGNIEQEGHNGKRKGWGRKKTVFFFEIVIFILVKL
jgi:hypothetical protein